MESVVMGVFNSHCSLLFSGGGHFYVYSEAFPVSLQVLVLMNERAGGEI